MSEQKVTQPTPTPALTAIEIAKQDALIAAKAAIEKKAEHLRVLDISEQSGFTDFFVICSGTSDKQVQAIASSIESAFEQIGRKKVTIEGYSDGRWILMDYGDIVVHVFLDVLREYYNLEALWSDAPNIKVPSEFYGPAASRTN